MTTDPPDPRSFTDNTVRLEHPEPDAIRDAFIRLPRRGSLDIRCRWGKRAESVSAIEGAGAFAICVTPLPGFEEVRVTALKGKGGPCYETGKTANYLGAAVAALDDDRHLIAGRIRVCEKTAGLYALPPYHGLLSVTEGEPDLLAKLDSAPVPFDCNTFEQDAGRVAGSRFESPSGQDEFMAVFYPGPFKLLVLKDGAMLRRGECTSIPACWVADLRERDRVIPLPSGRAREARSAESYPSLYATFGAGCLLEEIASAVPVPTVETTPTTNSPCVDPPSIPREAWNALKRSPKDLRLRVARLIERREPYFILSGSDPRDATGCCPSTEVESANRLVEAGVLVSHRIPAPPDACTTTIYAFAGEIRDFGDRPRFSVNAELRRRASRALGTAQSGTQAILLTALKLAVITLAVFSLVVAGRRAHLTWIRPSRPFDAALTQALAATDRDNRLFVCFFRGRDHCEACDTMGRLSRETVSSFALPERDDAVVFREVPYEAAGNKAIQRKLALGMSTVGLVHYANGAPRAIKMLTRGAWTLYADPPAFDRMLRDEIIAMLRER